MQEEATMPKTREVVVTPEQERERIGTRDHHQKASVRTKAAAILKVAAGQAMGQVAVQGLLKPVKEEMVKAGLPVSHITTLQHLVTNGTSGTSGTSGTIVTCITTRILHLRTLRHRCPPGGLPLYRPHATSRLAPLLPVGAPHPSAHRRHPASANNQRPK